MDIIRDLDENNISSIESEYHVNHSEVIHWLNPVRCGKLEILEDWMVEGIVLQLIKEGSARVAVTQKAKYILMSSLWERTVG